VLKVQCDGDDDEISCRKNRQWKQHYKTPSYTRRCRRDYRDHHYFIFCHSWYERVCISRYNNLYTCI